ncbi:PaaI family thioesterase [Luteimonas abyssi]|uniref:PaaI family thioesterase n=1 Tax=Luteimonas abyssi TaxID=1247514 RepID=UPI000737C079|nr:PaaI family thioesterase [Luteimonas abyssi]
MTDHDLPVLEFLRAHVRGTHPDAAGLRMRYPTAISRLLDFRIVAVDRAMAALELDADAQRHGNQQGTVHGGLLCELADATIGTAHSTLMVAGESFASIDLRTTFLRPVWRSRLRAHAWAEHRGRTISHYACEIQREDGAVVARAASAIVTLRDAAASGR